MHTWGGCIFKPIQINVIQIPSKGIRWHMVASLPEELRKFYSTKMMKEVRKPSSYDPYDTIWVTAVARTGTTWTINVVREILMLTNHRVFPL